jgi:hypothetical protein
MTCQAQNPHCGSKAPGMVAGAEPQGFQLASRRGIRPNDEAPSSIIGS